jgi:hypothetical protein
MPTKALRHSPATTASMACVAPPIARRVASKLPGDRIVSESIPTIPCSGTAAARASTYDCGWASVAASSAALGAEARTSPANRSSSSARSTARIRAGRSGWPSGTSWSKLAGWLTYRVVKTVAPG